MVSASAKQLVLALPETVSRTLYIVQGYQEVHVSPVLVTYQYAVLDCPSRPFVSLNASFAKSDYNCISSHPLIYLWVCLL